MTQFWANSDNLPLQFGPDKTRIDLGGDYVAFGPNRILECLITLGTTSFNAGVTNYGVPASFAGTDPSTAGIMSMTALFPTQPSAPVTVANSSGVLTYTKPQLYIDQIDLECLVAANAGTGGATGLTGIGLAFVNAGAFAQVTPNTGVQFLGSCVNARMTAGAHYTWYADGTAFGTGTPPTTPGWLGNVPLVTNATLPTHGYISAIGAGGTYSGSSGGGLLKLRVYYNWYGVINQ